MWEVLRILFREEHFFQPIPHILPDRSVEPDEKHLTVVCFTQRYFF